MERYTGMTPQSVHVIGSSLLALPLAMTLSKQLLLTQKSSVTRASVTGDARRLKSFMFRVTKVTAVLKGIPGYCHGGLND